MAASGNALGTAPLWQAQVNSNNLQTADYHFIITDHLGTPQMAVNQNGETTWKATAEVFGKTTPDATSQITMNLRFPGQYFDQETNTHYNYFRDYNPNIGRYVQSDPIGLEGGINLYGYVEGNPLYYIDVYGLLSSEAKRYVCQFLRNSDWNLGEAFSRANTSRKEIQPNGRNDWANPAKRDAENFLYAVAYSDGSYPGVFGHAFIKIPFWLVGKSTAPSLDAILAGLEGVDMQNNSKEYWQEYCSECEVSEDVPFIRFGINDFFNGPMWR